jgi:hypothetical protein
MKRIFTIAAALLMTASVWAQAPEKMSYQAVVRDAGNALVTSQAVGMQISILQGGATGTPVYVETQTPTTNANGLVSLEIGAGILVSGDFTIIDWANDTYFIKTETDPTGGTGYTITGTSQLMSVPYALYAKESGSSTPGPQGPAGNDGADGVDGADGNDGAVGPQGPIGLTGPAGNDGVDGIDGADGVGGVTTAGTNVSVTGAGTVGSPYVISSTGASTAPEYLYVRPDAITGGYVSFGTAVAVNGIAYNSTTDEFTLKAGKTYMLDGAVYMHTTTSTSTYAYVFYDKTNNVNISSEAYQRSTDYSGTSLINQPSMAGIVTPSTDIQVGVRDIYGSTGGFISSRGFFRIIELK